MKTKKEKFSETLKREILEVSAEFSVEEWEELLIRAGGDGTLASLIGKAPIYWNQRKLKDELEQDEQ